MEFQDFQIRAWTVDRKRAEVLVHSSPAGTMQRPLEAVRAIGGEWYRAKALSAPWRRI